MKAWRIDVDSPAGVLLVYGADAEPERVALPDVQRLESP